MRKKFDQEAVLDGIDINIEITEKQINDFEAQLNILAQGEANINRKTIIQQLSVLKEPLQLLKVRRVYVIGPQFSPEKREDTQVTIENSVRK